jgi:hypothetical protein
MFEKLVEPSRIYPGLRYRDAPAMIAWLCKAFGFTERVVYPGPDGAIAHAELTLGSGMIMLGSVRDDNFGAMVGAPVGPEGTGGQRPGDLHRDRRSGQALRPRRGGRRQDPDGPDRHRLWQPRLHLPRPRRLCLVLWHLLAQGARAGQVAGFEGRHAGSPS